MAGLKIKSASLVEAMVSILIITIVMFISLAIFENVSKSSQWTLKEKALSEINRKITEFSRNPSLLAVGTTREKKDGFICQFTLSTIDTDEQLYEVNCEAKSEMGEILVRRTIVIAND